MPLAPALTVLAALFVADLATDTQLTGTVTHVRDGDTIEVDGIPIRLNGLAAPELNEPFGTESTRFMRSLVHGKMVTCSLNGDRSYDRLVGICRLAGDDIAALIIRAGLALDCPRYSAGRYASDEEAARHTGIKSQYEPPGYCRAR